MSHGQRRDAERQGSVELCWTMGTALSRIGPHGSGLEVFDTLGSISQWPIFCPKSSTK